MAQIIDQDEISATVLGDNGEILRVPNEQLGRLEGLGFAPTAPEAQPASDEEIVSGLEAEADAVDPVEQGIEAVQNLPAFPQDLPGGQVAPQAQAAPGVAAAPTQLDAISGGQTAEQAAAGAPPPAPPPPEPEPVGRARQFQGKEVQSEAKRAQLAIEASGLEDKFRVIQDFDRQTQEIVDTERQAVGNARQKLDKELSDHRKTKTNPGRLLQRLPTGRRIMTVLGVLIAGLGSAFKGSGKNPALDLLLKAMDDDVDAQLREIQTRGVDLKEQDKNLTAREASVLKIPEQRQVLKQRRIADLQLLIDARLKRAKSAEEEGRLIEARGVLEVEAEKAADERMQQLIENARDERKVAVAEKNAESRRRGVNIAAKAERRAGVQQFFEIEKEAFARAERATIRAAEQAREGKVAELRNPVTNNVIGTSKFRSEAQVVKDQGAINGYVKTRTELAKYEAMLRKAGRTFRGPGSDASFIQSDEKKALDAQWNKVLSERIRAISGAQAAEAEVERLAKTIPAPQSFTDRADPRPIIQREIEALDQEHSQFLASRGIPTEAIQRSIEDTQIIQDTPVRLEAEQTGISSVEQAQNFIQLSDNPDDVIQGLQGLIDNQDQVGGSLFTPARKAKIKANVTRAIRTAEKAGNKRQAAELRRVFKEATRIDNELVRESIEETDEDDERVRAGRGVADLRKRFRRVR